MNFIWFYCLTLAMSRLVFVLYFICLIYIIPEISSEPKAKLPRYVVDIDVKPAIVGSHKYDVIEGVFKSQMNTSLTTELVAEGTTSTKSSLTTSEDSIRKHVVVTSTLINQLNWRTHARLLKNLTRKTKLNTTRAKQTK